MIPEELKNQMTAPEIELMGALESLLDAYLANRGTKHEFVSCITPQGIPWYWVRAKQAVERTMEVAMVRVQSAKASGASGGKKDD